MAVKRIIPCLDVKNGRVVKGVNFVNLVDAGNAVELAARYSDAGADELVFLDITASAEDRKTMVELVRAVAQEIRIPFTVGGGISSLQDIERMLKAGADKISLNTAMVTNPALISAAAQRFGSQAVVAAIDVKETTGGYKVFVKGGREETNLEGLAWCKEVEQLGAGEILLTSMHKDGTRSGYDIAFLALLQKHVRVPVIASGGAGSKQHFLDAFLQTDVDACLAAGLFHYGELAIIELKTFLSEHGVKVRV